MEQIILAKENVFILRERLTVSHHGVKTVAVCCFKIITLSLISPCFAALGLCFVMNLPTQNSECAGTICDNANSAADPEIHSCEISKLGMG